MGSSLNYTAGPLAVNYNGKELEMERFLYK